jgi:putative membrane protein
MTELTAARSRSSLDRSFWLFNAVLSAAALGFLAYILLLRRGSGASVDLSFMPAVNASFNALSTVLLAAGWIAIRNQARTAHKYLMVSAFASSSLFLVGYLVYHWVHGDTKFGGHGAIKGVYLLVLASHVLLSMVVVPLCLGSFYMAFRGSSSERSGDYFGTHRKIGRVLLPIWLYVSVTGVVIFLLLRAYS